MSGIIWLKHYSNKRIDPRVKLLSLPSKGVYYLLSEVAAQCDAKGAFVMNGIELTDIQISRLATIDDIADFRKAKKEMLRTGLMSVNGHGPYLTDFANEQMSQADRDKKWRDDKRKQRDNKQEVSQDVRTDNKQEVSQDVRALEERDKSQNKESLLLLSSEQREFVISKHPEWLQEAIDLASKNNKSRSSYIAGILKNWITEGRKQHANAKTQSGNRKRTNKPEGKQVHNSAGNFEAAKRALALRGEKTNV